ncbi:hypothetical protein N9Y14_05050, partial [Alphaproteobacteria bacterium]|nr:hypothetical protein [Alphaproteobacteria bacterium]
VTEQSWQPLLIGLFAYALFGPLYFMPQVRVLRKSGFKDIFPVPLIIFNVTIFVTNVAVTALMALVFGDMHYQLYSFCLLLFLVQCSSAFIRTIFYRAGG